MPKTLGWSSGEGQFLMSEAPLYTGSLQFRRKVPVEEGKHAASLLSAAFAEVLIT